MIGIAPVWGQHIGQEIAEGIGFGEGKFLKITPNHDIHAQVVHVGFYGCDSFGKANYLIPFLAETLT